MEATLFGSNRSWSRTLPASLGLSCRRKDTVLTSIINLGVPLIHQVLCERRGEIKPRKNDLCIENGETFPPSGPYATNSAILKIIFPHTGIINLGQINIFKILGCLGTAYPNCINTKYATEGVGAHQTFRYNDKASRFHSNYSLLP